MIFGSWLDPDLNLGLFFIILLHACEATERSCTALAVVKLLNELTLRCEMNISWPWPV